MSASTAAGPISSTTAQPPPVPRRHGFTRFLLVDSPYILMLLAALGGVSYRAFYGTPILGYWEILVVVFGALCIWAGLGRAKTSRQIYGLVWTQVLHWAAFFGAMMLLATSPVRSVLDDDAISILILTMLALAVFVAGVHGRAWRLCVVGLVLAAAVPAVTWIETSLSLIIFCVVMFLVVLLAFFLVRRRIALRRAA
jgi:hypothetical protein